MNMVPHPLNGRMHLMQTHKAIANMLMWDGRSFYRARKAVTLPSPYWNCKSSSKAVLEGPMAGMNGMIPEARARFINYMVGIK